MISSRVHFWESTRHPENGIGDTLGWRYWTIGFHNGMPGARNDSGPFSQSDVAAMTGPWLNSSNFQVGRSGLMGLACGLMRVQKALRIAPMLLRSSGSMSSSTATVATIHDP